MAFAEGVTTERTEYLIYTVFPLAISFWFISSLVGDPFQLLTYVSISSSLLTIFLFELRLDESLVRWFYSRVKGIQKTSLNESFVSWNVYLKTWQNPVKDAPQMMSDGGKTIDIVIEESTRSVVESYAIRKRLWSIRGSLYLFLSIPFLISVGIRYLRETSFSSFISFISIPTIFDPSGLFVSTLIVSSVFWSIQIIFNMHRYRTFREELKNLVIFRYVQKLLANDAIENPECYVNNMDLERINLQQELAYLDKVIARDDWAVFIDRWKPLRQNAERRGRVRFRENMIDDLFTTWLSHCVVDEEGKRPNNQIIETARILATQIHFIGEFLTKTNSRKLGHHSKAISQFTVELYYEITDFNPEEYAKGLSISKRIKSFVIYDDREYEFAPMKVRMLLKFMNPVYLASRATSKLLDDSPRGNETLVMSFGKFIALKLLQYFIGRIPENKLKIIQEEFSNKTAIRCNDITNLIVRLVTHCQQEGSKTGIWNNLGQAEQIETLETVLDWLSSHEREQGVIIESFLREAGIRARKNLLRDPDWQLLIKNTQKDFIRDVLTNKIQYSPKIRIEMEKLPYAEEIMSDEI
ncbi:MAG: hypothetical protein GF411_13320 [Candidatus Lokiarchaeota archaeon]|nr:hypothetical protein [Candidatus Lokiarchaeota archaeon]